MTIADRESYRPGKAWGARVEKEGERWTLILVRELRHAPETVWEALTDPAQLAEWAPYDADRDLGVVGTAKLTLASSPKPQVFESTVKRAEKPRLLEYTWGEADVRWELEPMTGGTRLKLWHNIDRRFIAWGAAGWHICFDVMEKMLGGAPIGRIVGGDAVRFEWERLNAEYAEQFGVDSPKWPARAPQNS